MLTREDKYYQDGVIFGVDQFNVTKDSLVLRASNDMNDYALIFGQEPDRIRGGFEKDQAYLGYLSEFNVWNYTLDEKDIFKMGSCNTQIKGNIVAWEISGLLKHNIPVRDIKDISFFCSNSSKYVIFPEKMSFSQGGTYLQHPWW